MFVLFNPVEFEDYATNNNANKDIWESMNEWVNNTVQTQYQYRHYLNWNKTEHTDYNQVPGAAGVAAGTIVTTADTVIGNGAPGGIITNAFLTDNEYNYEKKYIDI